MPDRLEDPDQARGIARWVRPYVGGSGWFTSQRSEDDEPDAGSEEAAGVEAFEVMTRQALADPKLTAGSWTNAFEPVDPKVASSRAGVPEETRSPTPAETTAERPGSADSGIPPAPLPAAAELADAAPGATDDVLPRSETSSATGRLPPPTSFPTGQSPLGGPGPQGSLGAHPSPRQGQRGPDVRSVPGIAAGPEPDRPGRPDPRARRPRELTGSPALPEGRVYPEPTAPAGRAGPDPGQAAEPESSSRRVRFVFPGTGAETAAARSDPELSGHSSRPEAGRPNMSKQQELARVIYDMRRSIPELHGVMIASTDGLPISHDFLESEAERVAAMAATALGLGKRITERNNLGGLQETVVRGDHGYVVVYAAGENGILVMSGPITSNLGLMRIEARAASSLVGQILR